MNFISLRSFIRHLEAIGELVRVRAPVDPNQEITIILHRVLAQKGPALLFENIKGSSHRLVANLFGTKKRVDMVFGGPPAQLGERLLKIFEKMMPPSLRNLWKLRQDLLPLAHMRLRKVSRGPVIEHIQTSPDINKLPVLTCWPEDGGPFFTLPLVHTVDPLTGRGNLGIYRLQRFDGQSTGMHWQIEKGGGFHFHAALEMGESLPVSVILGGPPALIIAAVAPLPEGIDERLLASYMMGVPLDVISRSTTGHLIPARAEFVMEGIVTGNDQRMEGPFGDHFGHYSKAAEYPVLRIKQILARKDAIYPATVVGKPVQEDYYIGMALQELTFPLLKITKPAITDFWAYPETGFHSLAVMAVKQRYQGEALKHTLGMLGEGQVSLTKIMITVDSNVNVKDFKAVSQALWNHLDSNQGIFLLAPTAQDTLDFTGPAMNTGSRLLLIATAGENGPLRQKAPLDLPEAAKIHPDINALISFGPAFVMVQLKDRCTDTRSVRKALHEHPVTGQYLFHVLLSEDVALDNEIMLLWGWFTRFDPLADLYPKERRICGNRLVFDFPIAIDARWKKGYPRPVEFDPAVEKKVDQRWSEYELS